MTMRLRNVPLSPLDMTEADKITSDSVNTLLILM